jgi:GH15 family glucan-1,4-alpha-glucosidase
LIDDRAALVWGCAPRVDGDPLFCSLLDPKDAPTRGEWRITLEDQVGIEQRYLRNTAILVTRLTDAQGGIAELFDFCPRFERTGRTYRPVAFARIIRPVSGAPRVRIDLNPAVNWGAKDADRTSGSNHIRFLLKPQPLRLTTDAPVTNLLEGRSFRLEKALHFFLGPDEPFVGNVAHTLATMLHETSDHWREWVRGLAIPLEWQTVVIRAAITLKLCQHEETGAIVAALTTSIPEAANSGRNWDYRYCWIRDAYYTVQALNRLGALDVLERYLSYLRNIVDDAKGGHIQPLYAVSGRGEDRGTGGGRPRRLSRDGPGARRGTQLIIRSSTTLMGRSSCPTCRPFSTNGCSARPPSMTSRRSRRSANAPGRCTTSPMRGSGNSAPARPSTPTAR